MRTKRDAVNEWNKSVKQAGKWTDDDDRKARELIASLGARGAELVREAADGTTREGYNARITEGGRET